MFQSSNAMQAYRPEVEQQMQRFYQSLSEKDRRRYAPVEAIKLGWGGLGYVGQLLECDDEAMQRGKQELASLTAVVGRGDSTVWRRTQISMGDNRWTRCCVFEGD